MGYSTCGVSNFSFIGSRFAVKYLIIYVSDLVAVSRRKVGGAIVYREIYKSESAG